MIIWLIENKTDNGRQIAMMEPHKTDCSHIWIHAKTEMCTTFIGENMIFIRIVCETAIPQSCEICRWITDEHPTRREFSLSLSLCMLQNIFLFFCWFEYLRNNTIKIACDSMNNTFRIVHMIPMSRSLHFGFESFYFAMISLIRNQVFGSIMPSHIILQNAIPLARSRRMKFILYRISLWIICSRKYHSAKSNQLS